MHLTTIPDYIAVWILLLIGSLVLYTINCALHGDYVKDEQIKNIFVADTLIMLLLWAIRHLFF